ncbi:MAG TPA: DUF1674 domain-containing protein [Hyphomicrobium sp.]|jgi:hypothetical protein
MKPSEIDAPKSSDAAGDTRPLTPEARRALAEAEARRQKAAAEPSPREIGGRDGPEPTRFGDWEKGGLASDF